MSFPALNPDSAAPLRDEAARLAAAYGADLLLELGSDGVVVAANATALRDLRCEQGQLVGRPFAELLEEGSRDKGRALLANAARGPTTTYELNHLAGDGAIVPIGYRGVPIPPDETSDRREGVLLIGRPLSAAVAATERLVGLNRRLNALFAIAAVASRSLVLADMLDEVLRLTLAELDAQAGLVLLADAPAALDPPHRRAGAARLRLVAQRGLSPTAAERLYEALHPLAGGQPATRRGEPFVLRGDGELGIAPADLLASAGPLLSLAGVPLRSERRLLGWLYLVSDRYRAFDAGALELVGTIGGLLGPPVENAQLYGALIEASGQLGALLDNIDSGVLLIDGQNIVRYANARLGELLGADVGRWPGQPRGALLGALLAPVERPSAPFYGDLWATAGPPRRVLRRFTNQVTEPGGGPAGTIEVYSDVTTLHEMDQLKDEFVAAAAHDLKTPVTAVKGYTQIALRLARKSGDQRLLQQLEMINARSDDLAYLMDTLLDMSRIQAGRLRLDVEPAALSALVGRVARHFEFDLRRQKRTLAVDLPGEAIDLEWDGPRVERLLINLIGNALKYSPAGGPVELRARHLDDAGEDTIELAVTDHGIGIPPEERDRIFERFFRGRQAIADAFKGSGLGLYISQGVVAAHGGRIWAADALHGGPGTTIFVVLPRVAEPEQA